MGPAVRLACLALPFAWMQGAAAQEALYRLPYLEGQAYTISQAPGGFITTHTTKDSRHAVDFKMPEGTPVVAAREGVVIAAEWHYQAGAARQALRSQGNVVRMRHYDGTVANYAHLMHFGVAVEDGEIIEAGRILGYSGSTGYASGPHLHFGVTGLQRAGDTTEEVSVPVRFYNGDRANAFAPRVGLAVTAAYALPDAPMAVPPLAPPAVARSEPRRDDAAQMMPSPEVIAGGFARLAAWCVFGVLGMAWFYRFSRS